MVVLRAAAGAVTSSAPWCCHTWAVVRHALKDGAAMRGQRCSHKSVVVLPWLREQKKLMIFCSFFHVVQILKAFVA